MSTQRTETQLQGITDLCLLAVIKPGNVEAFETISHVERLRRVLKTLNGLRLAARESTLTPGLFTDVVQRLRIVHSFRWAIIEPRAGIDPAGTPHKFMLNVCFDGGWEPYMRVIWGDLGSMLDLMLCHCEGYPLAREHSFERYMAWVRANEFSADFLYLESARSCADHDYLAALEAQQRLRPTASAPAAALAATRVHLPPASEKRALPAGPAERFAMAVRGLPALAALHALERYFFEPNPAAGADGACLLRAARDILFELVDLSTPTLFPVTPPAAPTPQQQLGHALRQTHARMLGWFERRPPTPALQPRDLPYSDAFIQGGMLSAYPALSGGALVLLRVAQLAQAVAWLSAFKPSSEADTLAGTPPVDGIYRNLALSLAGLRALGVPASRLARFPQPFIEGMDGRAGILGDIGHNHPRHWRLPERNWPAAEGATPRTVELASVHVLIQLRHGSQLTNAELQRSIAELEQGSGLQVLSVQTMRRNAGSDGQPRESFGFVDGLSQPVVHGAAQASGAAWSDQVPRGELLLGYPSSRDRVAVPEQADALLDHGTFLVVRKLRQRLDRLNAVLDPQAAKLGLTRSELLAKMMGRELDGRALAAPRSSGNTNDFNYSADANGAKCPLHAHIRRANPRDGQMPRMLRRGMSYGAADGGGGEHGLIFMAYNANLAEQFETIQRWLAGGNSSGGHAEQSDPFLGVATAGQPRIYRFEHAGKAVHLNLGEQPLVELQWGGYFFVPSLPALRNLPSLVELPLPAPIAAPLQGPAPEDAAAWQQWLEDAGSRDAAWRYVRGQPGGVMRTAYGVLVGDAAQVMAVFRDPEQRYSVSGYGERMSHSIGRGYLGMDEDGGHREQAPAINAAIEQIGEQEAFDAAYGVARAVIAGLSRGNHALQLDEALLDLERLSELVLDKLCTRWFGLPDGKHMWGCEWHAPDIAGAKTETPRCPRDFFAVSRYVFGPQPSALVERISSAKGQGLLQSVRDWLASGPQLPRLSQAIADSLQPLVAGDADIVPRTLAGIMLGFPPTVHGNLVSSLAAWVVSKKLWDLQQDWPPVGADQAYGQAVAMLRTPLIATMLGRPVPGMVWRLAREAHTLSGVEVEVGDKIIVGIASCTQHNPSDHYAMFGGDRRDAVDPAPLHACPGYAMAMGVMLGVSAAVLEAGTLRTTGAPMVLGLQLG